jgi:hypothetical protein
MRATFIGKKPFPLEMLREEECFPSTNTDIANILCSIKRLHNVSKEYEITLTKRNDRPWEIDRWARVGYKLKKVYLP